MGRKNGYLAKRREVIRRVEKSSSTTATNRTFWIAVVALNEEFGFGAKRAQRFFNAVARVAMAFEKDRADGDDVAEEHLRRRLEKILHAEVRRVE